MKVPSNHIPSYQRKEKNTEKRSEKEENKIFSNVSDAHLNIRLECQYLHVNMNVS